MKKRICSGEVAFSFGIISVELLQGNVAWTFAEKSAFKYGFLILTGLSCNQPLFLKAVESVFCSLQGCSPQQAIRSLRSFSLHIKIELFFVLLPQVVRDRVSSHCAHLGE